MTALTAGTLLVLFLPFLLSLAGQAGTPKVLCFVTSLLATLLSVREFGAVLPGRKNAPLTMELTTGRGSTKFKSKT